MNFDAGDTIGEPNIPSIHKRLTAIVGIPGGREDYLTHTRGYRRTVLASFGPIGINDYRQGFGNGEGRLSSI